MADNYGMEVKASVKLPTSADIDKQIRKLEKSISKLQVSGKFEESTLKNLTNQLNTLKANIATASFSQDALQTLTTQVNNALQGIQINNIGNGNQAQQAGQNIGRQISEGIDRGLGGNSEKIREFSESLRSLGVGDSDIQRVVERLNGYNIEIKDLGQTIDNIKKKGGLEGFLTVTGSGIDALGQTVSITEKLSIAAVNASDAMENLVKSSIKVTSGTQSGGTKQIADETERAAKEAERLNNVLKGLEKARGSSDAAGIRFRGIDDADNVKRAISEVKGALREFDNLGDNASLHQMEQQLEVVRSAVKRLTEEVKVYNEATGKNISITSIDKVNADAETLINTLKKFSSDNDGFKDFSVDIRGTEVSLTSLIEKLETVSSADDLKVLKSQAEALKSSFSELAQINEINLLANGGVKNDYSTQIAKLQGNFKALGDSEETAREKTQSIVDALNNLQGELSQPLETRNFDNIKTANEAVKTAIANVSNEYTRAQAEAKGYATAQQRLTLANTIEAWNQKNTAATKAVLAKNNEYIASLRDLDTTIDKIEFNKIKDGFKKAENSMRGLGKLGATVRDQFKQAVSSFSTWLSASTAVMTLISKTREAVTELKEVDTLLTEITKANDKLTKSQLAGIGDRSFETASRYGKKATDYLKGVQEMSRAGYQDAEAMGELSVKAQGAGDMTEDVANSFIIATDKAYKMNGSIQELTKTMDGINYITNHNAVNMTELSEGFSIVASTAASFGVDANELSAALGTMAASTQQSGSEVARAFRAILLNIRQVSDKWLLKSSLFAPYVQKCA